MVPEYVRAAGPKKSASRSTGMGWPRVGIRPPEGAVTFGSTYRT